MTETETLVERRRRQARERKRKQRGAGAGRATAGQGDRPDAGAAGVVGAAAGGRRAAGPAPTGGVTAYTPIKIGALVVIPQTTAAAGEGFAAHIPGAEGHFSGAEGLHSRAGWRVRHLDDGGG